MAKILRLAIYSTDDETGEDSDQISIHLKEASDHSPADLELMLATTLRNVHKCLHSRLEEMGYDVPAAPDTTTH